MNRIVLKFKNFLANRLAVILVAAVVVLSAVFLLAGKQAEDGSITLDGSKAKYSKATEKALCELAKKRETAIAGIMGLDVPQDSGSGCEAPDKELAQMGSGVYYKTDLSSPAAFVNAMNGRGFNEGYGLQCVAGFKQFMFSLSGRVVATRTGGASGYANQVGEIQALGFTWHAGQAGMKDGDWAIFGGGQYGHVAMYYQGKFFGQNQGSGNIYVGNAFNLMDLGGYHNSIIGYYRPNIWNGTASAPAAPAVNSKAVNDQVVADVLKGVYGSGNDRVARLQAAGYNPAEVQAAVNARVAAQAPRVVAPRQNYAADSTGGYVVRRGDTLGHIALRNGWHGASGLFGNSGYTQRLAERNGIVNRGLIYPGQRINP
ncbi:LysM peptidoglycan-binding domain-containing protein [Candidatus Nanosynbacter lyticus]|uniref:LysM peptidoglycan-binding domain-containing protein n=1 Tax=Candidatus Nanosynbacter lyticus TaxID=2093824 RepID=UPI0038D1F821